ncbi:transporter substrate-binding domain-containing protein [Legionella sp. km772]|uniref:transporter substrate-binding domain-containing protein n=1 Tax=Legionella sp. km772 TaxID=2498111 RepID=UPI0013153845|nr:transporter substrate-binding domain-containing protein [Legionella sp. km772]
MFIYFSSFSAYATIRVGIPFYKPPFIIDKYDGFDINLMNIICERLQEHCEFQPMLFHTLYISLENKEIDLAIGGLTISEERETLFLFSQPYLASNGTFLVLANSPLKTAADLEQKNIGVIQDSVYGDYLLDQYGSKVKIVSFIGPLLMFFALNSHQIDAIFSDERSVNYWIQHNDGVFKVLGKPCPIGSGFAIMANPDSTNLINAINGILKQLEQDGTYDQLYEQYFF